jgi:Glycosyltransferase sugar-binding region containing DXD motif
MTPPREDVVLRHGLGRRRSRRSWLDHAAPAPEVFRGSPPRQPQQQSLQRWRQHISSSLCCTNVISKSWTYLPGSRRLSKPAVMILAIQTVYLTAAFSVAWIIVVIFFYLHPHHQGTTISNASQRHLRPVSRNETGTSLHHVHAIPNILIFTHYQNLLLPPPYGTHEAELSALHDNVQHTNGLHPGAVVRFLTNDDCVASLERVIPHLSLKQPVHEQHGGMAQQFVQYFRDEPVGMYQGDLCRGAALYETGGLYFDVDLGVRLPLFGAANADRLNTTLTAAPADYVLQPTTQFVTVQVHFASKHPGDFFQAFVGVTPRHAILKRYLELFWEYYTHQLHPSVSAKDPLGVVFLRRAYNQVGSDHVELWQELLYAPALQRTAWLSHVPPPTWGTRRACKFVVITRVPTRLQPYNPTLSHDEKRALLQQWGDNASHVHFADDDEPLTVPFYSRIANSRMCPVEHHNASHAVKHHA